MKKSDIFPSNYIKASDIADREIPVVIARTEMEKLGDDDKLIVYFQNATKGLVCNMTNFDRISYVCGSDDTDHWPGHEVVLFTELATFQGKTAPAVRVKAPPKKAAGNGPAPQNFATQTGMRPATPPISSGVGGGGNMDDEIPF